MAEQSDKFTFVNSQNQEETIDIKDLVAIVPDTGSNDSKSSLILHVSPHPADAATPPTLNITKATPTSTPPPQIQPLTSLPNDVDYETHIIISTGSGTNQASPFFNTAVSPLLHTLFPTLYPKDITAEEATLTDTSPLKNHHFSSADKSGSFHVYTTTSASSVQDITTSVLLPAATAGRPLLVILLSGDGGIVDLVNGLVAPSSSATYLPPKLLPLPLGTANALYHSTYPPNPIDETWGLRLLTTVLTTRSSAPASQSAPLQWHPLPTFTATFSPHSKLLINEARDSIPLPPSNPPSPSGDANATEAGTGTGILHGAVVFSWGMHASLVADSDSAAYRRFGIERFKLAAKEALFPEGGRGPHVYRGRVCVLAREKEGGREVGKEGTQQEWIPLQEEEHLYVLATLVSRLEKSFTISPSSRPLSSSLHLIRFGPRTGDDAMRLMGLAYQGGRHVEEGDVLYEEVEGVRVEFDEGEEEEKWRRVCVDGKIVVVSRGGWVEVRKGVRGDAGGGGEREGVLVPVLS